MVTITMCGSFLLLAHEWDHQHGNSKLTLEKGLKEIILTNFKAKITQISQHLISNY